MKKSRLVLVSTLTVVQPPFKTVEPSSGLVGEAAADRKRAGASIGSPLKHCNPVSLDCGIVRRLIAISDFWCMVLQAQKIRTRLMTHYRRIFFDKGIDYVATPTTGTTAPIIRCA